MIKYGEVQLHCIGLYIPPWYTPIIKKLRELQVYFTTQILTIILRDFNVWIETPETTRDFEISSTLEELYPENIVRSLYQPRKSSSHHK